MIYINRRLLSPTSDFIFILSRFPSTSCQGHHAALTIQLSGSGTNSGTIIHVTILPQNNYTSFDNQDRRDQHLRLKLSGEH